MLRRIKSSIFLKLFLSITFILILSSLLIYGIIMIATPESYKSEANQRFSESVVELTKQLADVSRKEAESIITAFCIDNRAVAVLNGGGERVGFGDLTIFENTGKDENEATKSIATEIRFKDSDVQYTFTTSTLSKTENELAATFWRLFPWIVLIIAVISVIGSLASSRILAKPVLEISRISKRMSELDMAWSCDIDRTDELGVLSNSLNTMALKLRASMDELENANRQLKADIEKEKAQEKQRRTFFAAVSHELKTPITILKGQMESMIYEIGDYKDKEKYLPMALETVERMENLVRELLTLSKLTADGFSLEMRPVDLSLAVRESLSFYKPLAQEKNIVLAKPSLESVTATVNKNYFEKALSNVLKNAILYSPSGESVVTTLTPEALTIENTGVHIPGKKLTELFAPLTRVEESRNKYTGGSGLGLYIVKTILDLHGLPHEIQNSERGVRFNIYLNQNQK